MFHNSLPVIDRDEYIRKIYKNQVFFLFLKKIDKITETHCRHIGILILKQQAFNQKEKTIKFKGSHTDLTPDEIKVPLMIIQAIIPMCLCEFYQSDTDSLADEVLLPDSPVR